MPDSGQDSLWNLGSPQVGAISAPGQQSHIRQMLSHGECSGSLKRKNENPRRYNTPSSETITKESMWQGSIPLERSIYCGRQHQRVKEKCPLLRLHCKGYGNLNHLNCVCTSKGRSQKDPVRLVKEGNGTSDSDDDIMTLSQSLRAYQVQVRGTGKKQGTISTSMHDVC